MAEINDYLKEQIAFDSFKIFIIFLQHKTLMLNMQASYVISHECVNQALKVRIEQVHYKVQMV